MTRAIEKNTDENHHTFDLYKSLKQINHEKGKYKSKHGAGVKRTNQP